MKQLYKIPLSLCAMLMLGGCVETVPQSNAAANEGVINEDVMLGIDDGNYLVKRTDAPATIDDNELNLQMNDPVVISVAD